jgi:hypothetical protein
VHALRGPLLVRLQDRMLIALLRSLTSAARTTINTTSYMKLQTCPVHCFLQAVSLLQSGDPDLAAKSASARKLGSTRVIGRQDIVYTTDKGTEEQVNAQEADEFDRRLGVNRRGLPPGGSSSRRVDDVFGRREQRLRQQQQESEKIEVDWGGRGSSSKRSSGERRRQRDEDWDRLDRW